MLEITEFHMKFPMDEIVKVAQEDRLVTTRILNVVNFFEDILAKLEVLHAKSVGGSGETTERRQPRSPADYPVTPRS